MLFILAIALTLASAQAKFYTDCGSKLATVKNVGVSGCAEDAKECVLRRNTNATISVDFVPSTDVESLETVVHGIIMNLPVPFPMPQPDACKDSGLNCPLKAGEEAFYKTTMPVLKSYPRVKVEVKWELKNDSGDYVCIMIPAKIN
ncbi:ecdysteroid-regulated 16 kDa protein [Danaus plexippus]|uniref:Ecdysteroid regulated n=1 Tax=Danaus plexippus plexippus TaxID=278856 RepID=A0A212ENK2_DANPL|nr:ecdysteroid-regulated 16 kDa protein [Danaus plexippus]OWR43085.1 ecdysteroid regulated [Danaus plexippus plexippus]